MVFGSIKTFNEEIRLGLDQGGLSSGLTLELRFGKWIENSSMKGGQERGAGLVLWEDKCPIIYLECRLKQDHAELHGP